MWVGVGVGVGMGLGVGVGVGVGVGMGIGVSIVVGKSGYTCGSNFIAEFISFIFNPMLDKVVV